MIISKGTFSVTCEGSYKTSELVDQGKYGLVDFGITNKRFPLLRHTPVNKLIELVQFNYDPTSAEVLAEFACSGLKRPIYEDALYFGIQYPEKQKEHDAIVFLHEPVWISEVSSEYVLCLQYGSVTKRNLDLVLFHHRFIQEFAFAAIRPDRPV